MKRFLIFCTNFFESINLLSYLDLDVFCNGKYQLEYVYYFISINQFSEHLTPSTFIETLYVYWHVENMPAYTFIRGCTFIRNPRVGTKKYNFEINCKDLQFYVSVVFTLCVVVIWVMSIDYKTRLKASSICKRTLLLYWQISAKIRHFVKTSAYVRR